MTSQSRKKRRITVPTCSRATRFSLTLLLASSTFATQAQSPVSYPVGQQRGFSGVVKLRPVPRGPIASTPQPKTQTNPLASDLQWRRSSKAPVRQQPQSSANDGAGQPQALQVARETPNLQPVNTGAMTQPGGNPQAVAQTAWLDHPKRSELFPPETGTRLAQAQSERTPSGNNFFDNPFGDDALPGRTATATQSETEFLLPPQGEPAADPSAPGESEPMNELRNAFDELEAPAPLQTPAPAPQRTPAPAKTPSARRTRNADETLGMNNRTAASPPR